MKSAKFFILPGILFIAAIILIVKSLIAMNVSAEPFVGTIDEAEKKDISGYSYFKLSGGFAIPVSTVYELETPGNKVTGVVYPYVSGAYYDKVLNAYLESHNGEYDEIDFADWLEKYKDKPKFYVSAKQDSTIYENELIDIMLADTLPKAMEGTRIHSMLSLGSIITDEYERQGVTVDDAVFIDEGVTPEKDKDAAQVVVVFGCILAVIGLVLAFVGSRNLKRQKNQEMLFETFKTK